MVKFFFFFLEMFEGLGLGSRLAYLELPKGYDWVPIAGGIVYSIATPLGVAIGLGVRSTYNPDSMIANLVTGTLDSISAGILLYTGLVEVFIASLVFCIYESADSLPAITSYWHTNSFSIRRCTMLL